HTHLFVHCGISFLFLSKNDPFGDTTLHLVPQARHYFVVHPVTMSEGKNIFYRNTPGRRWQYADEKIYSIGNQHSEVSRSQMN
ncbi:MAG: hypothetical protein SVV80_13500, partial [Planctomycetota bacterium]|nr:hypothetical protein [Planctomycetota bacterium]